MDEQQTYPTFVITLLQDGVPVCMLQHRITGKHEAEADIWHDGIEPLEIAAQQFEAARRAVEYRIWKVTGKLPAPVDMELSDEPF